MTDEVAGKDSGVAPEGLRREGPGTMGEPGSQHILRLLDGWDGWVSNAYADKLCRERCAVPIPEEFPRLPMPAADGEPLAAYVERAINRHPLIVAINSFHVVLAHKPLQRLAKLQPEQRTVDWWKKRQPAIPDGWEDEEWMPPPSLRVLTYQRERWRMRLMVELFERLRGGDLISQGIRRDDPDQVPRPVRQGLWRHPDMVLNPETGRFWPEAPRGQSAPSDKLPEYRSLTLHAEVANVPRAPHRTYPAKATAPDFRLNPLEDAGGRPARRRGRSFRGADAPLVAEMHKRIVAGIDATATDAARAVVHKAQGNGTQESKIQRLVARYHSEYGQPE
jgi:hypothetical protein